MRTFASEMIGAFALVFAGTGAIVVDSVSGGAVSHVGVSLVFGLIVMAMIHVIGDVSGAHMNPAVTVGFAAARRFPWGRVGPYVAAQCIGAFAASLLLSALFDGHSTLGATLPVGSAGRSFVLEVVITWMLMLAILAVSDGARERGTSAALVIGAVVALAALFAGPISGASMNPARSLAPALVSGATQDLWIYISAPVLGALLAVPCCRLMRAGACCQPVGAFEA
ncbi:MAG: aquaporin [Planctomycetes bacterium]|nr:aquaporin [Planctomycetota bacterium]